MPYQSDRNMSAFAYSKQEIDQKLLGLQTQRISTPILRMRGTTPFNTTGTSSYRTFPEQAVSAGNNWERWCQPRTGDGGIDIKNLVGGKGIVQMTVYARLAGTSPAIAGFSVATSIGGCPGSFIPPDNIIAATALTAPNQLAGAMVSVACFQVANSCTVWGAVTTGTVVRSVDLYTVDLILLAEGF